MHPLAKYIPEGAAACEVRVGSALYVYANTLGLFFLSSTKSWPGPKEERVCEEIEGHPLFPWQAHRQDAFEMTTYIYPDALRLTSLDNVTHIVPALGPDVPEDARGVWLAGEGEPAPVVQSLPCPGDRIFSRITQCNYRLPLNFMKSLPKDASFFLVVGRHLHQAALTVRTRTWRALVKLIQEPSTRDYSFQLGDRVFSTDAWDGDKFKLKEVDMKIPSLGEIEGSVISDAISKARKGKETVPAPAMPVESKASEQPAKEDTLPAVQEPAPAKETATAQETAPMQEEPAEAKEEQQAKKAVRQKKPVVSLGFDFQPALDYLQSTIEKAEVTEDNLDKLTQERRALRDLMIYASRRLFNIDDMLVGSMQESSKNNTACLAEKLAAISKILK